MLRHHVTSNQIKAGISKGKRSQRCASAPRDIDVFASVGKIEIDANYGAGAPN